MDYGNLLYGLWKSIVWIMEIYCMDYGNLLYGLWKSIVWIMEIYCIADKREREKRNNVTLTL